MHWTNVTKVVCISHSSCTNALSEILEFFTLYRGMFWTAGFKYLVTKSFSSFISNLLNLLELVLMMVYRNLREVHELTFVAYLWRHVWWWIIMPKSKKNVGVIMVVGSDVLQKHPAITCILYVCSIQHGDFTPLSNVKESAT